MEPSVLWTDEWQVYLIGVQLLVLLVAAAVAAWQVLEARKLRLQQNRPFVVIDFEVEGGFRIYLEITNVGTSLARNVQIAIDPPLNSAIGVQLANMKMLNDGIPTLPPGKTIKTLYDFFMHRKDESLPSTHTAVLSYTDEDGGREYEESFVLDLELYRHLSTVHRKDVHDLHEQLEQINQTLKAWSANIGPGLVAVNDAEAKERNRRVEAEMAAFRAQPGPGRGLTH